MARATVVGTAVLTGKKIALAKVAPGGPALTPSRGPVGGSAGPAAPLCGRAVDQEIV